MESFLGEFTLYRLLVDAIYTLILTGLGRLAMWLFKFRLPRKEWAYWVVGSLLVFATIATLSQIANPARPEDRPDLRLTVDHMMVTDIILPNGKGPGLVLLVATIRNRGQAPTTAEGFKLTVKAPDGNTFTGDRATLPQRGKFSTVDGPDIWLSSDDDLGRKATTLIPRGAHMRGRLASAFEKLPKKDLQAKGNVFTLTIADNWGRQISQQLPPLEFVEKFEIRDFPGMRSQSELERPDVIPEKK